MSSTAKSGVDFFQQGAFGSAFGVLGSQLPSKKETDPRPLLDHMFEFLSNMREKGVRPLPLYDSMPKWIRRLAHTPYAAIKDLDLRFLKACIHVDGYLAIVGVRHIDYSRLVNRPSYQGCINLAWKTTKSIRGRAPDWYSHAKPVDTETPESRELDANIKLNVIIFGEDGHHLSPLHREEPDQYPTFGTDMSLDDSKFMSSCESNEHRKKLRYALKPYNGVIADTSHPRYAALSVRRRNSLTWKLFIKPTMVKLFEMRETYLDKKFYSVELLARLNRFVGTLEEVDPDPPPLPPQNLYGVSAGATLISHVLSPEPAKPSVLKDTLASQGVTSHFIAEVFFALGAKQGTVDRLFPGAQRGDHAGAIAAVLSAVKERPQSWAEAELNLLDQYVPQGTIPPEGKALLWREVQHALPRIRELSSEKEFYAQLRKSRFRSILTGHGL
jgi:hypothetical protein